MHSIAWSLNMPAPHVDHKLTTACTRAAELLDALPEASDDDELDQQVTDESGKYLHPAFLPNPDPHEAALEAAELNKYLLAKSFFDCKEFDRCAAVFLPESLLSGLLSSRPDGITTPKGKGKANIALPSEETLPSISQKSLFLALYAKVLSGEKRKDEDSEMIMGPQDLGSVVNKQLLVVSHFLARWLAERKTDDGELPASQGFLEYLYGAGPALHFSIR
jgi:anaphase-promoting complex subunit 8